MFTIENLRFQHILSIPKLTIDKQITCIVGASGSGKTTLLKMLNRMLVPDEGIVRWNGEDLSKMNSVALRREVVMLGQTPVLYPGTIGENLQIGRLFSERIPRPETALREILQKVELEKLPDDRCANLSGGEKQRLCLARVLLMDADVYLLDEPSSALDKKNRGVYLKCSGQFCAGARKRADYSHPFAPGGRAVPGGAHPHGQGACGGKHRPSPRGKFRQRGRQR